MSAALRLTLSAALVLAVQPARATAPDWVCLGTSPGFMMTLSGGQATFDYLGDGRYRMEPPVPKTLPDAATRHDLVTRRDRIAVFLERRACHVLGAELPLSVEIAIPTSLGLRPMTGCCKALAGR